MPIAFHPKEAAAEKKQSVRDSASESAAIIAALQKDMATSEAQHRSENKAKGRAQAHEARRDEANSLGPGWRREKDLRV